jgi:sodium transport system permease protein
VRSLKNIWNILKKEFFETFRDKAFIYTNFIGPLIFFPVLLILIGEITSVKIQNIKKEKYQLYQYGTLPATVQDGINKAKKIDLRKKNSRLESFLSEVSSNLQNEKSYKFTPEQKKMALDIYNSQRLDLILLTIKDEKQFRIHILHDSTRPRGSRAYSQITDHFNKFNKTQSENVLNNYKIAKEDLKPLVAKLENIQPSQKTLGHSIGIIASFFIIFLLITAIHHPAIHSTIGERDGQTLNFLLMSPLSTREILIGKYINIALQGLLSLIPYGLQLVIAYYNFNTFFEDANLSFLTFGNVSFILLLIFSVSLFLSSISFTLTCMAKSMAQAQTLMSFIIFLVFVPLGLLKGLELGIEQNYAFIPVVNFALGMQDIMMMGMHYQFYLTTILINVICSVLLVMYADYFFKAQNILSKGDAGIFDALSLKKIKMREPNPTLSVILGLTIPFFVINSNSFAFMKNNPLYLTLFHSIFINLVVTIMVLRFYKTDFKKAMALHKFKVKHAWGSACLVLGMFPIVYYLTSKLPGYESMQQSLSDSMSSINHFPIWVHIIFFAIFPGVCEEISYRGVILTGFRKRFPPFIAIVTTSLLFSMGHFSLLRIIPMLALGLAMGFVATSSRSVYPSIIGHVLFNGFAIVISHSDYFTSKEFSGFESFMITLCSFLFMALGSVLLSSPKEFSPQLENYAFVDNDIHPNDESENEKDSKDKNQAA